MIETFVPKSFSAAHTAIIEQADSICAEYRQQGLDVTLRQLYYQFVARDLLPNTLQSYKRLGGILNDARLAGALDWAYMVDRGRNVVGGFAGYADPGTYVAGVADGYIEALWADQEYRPEVWVEKEALVQVIAQGTAETRTPRFACKGYVSQSEMYAAARRMRRRLAQGTTPVVIYLGDHDPSGLDMTRDVRDRLALMVGEPVEVVRIALNRDQIDLYDPPPNPAKLTDSRVGSYLTEHGNSSWELDALDPAVLRDLVTEAVENYLDRDLFAAAVEREQAGEDSIREVADRWEDLRDRWDEVLEVLDS